MNVARVREKFGSINGQGGPNMKKAIIITSTVVVTAAVIGGLIWHFRKTDKSEKVAIEEA